MAWLCNPEPGFRPIFLGACHGAPDFDDVGGGGHAEVFALFNSQQAQ